MRLPVIEGIIRRRLLVNFRVDPEIMQRHLPARFRPKLQDGQAVAGICLIRLEQIRPQGFPELVGISSENAAHRVAVFWDDEEGAAQEGVYVLRRDTASRLNSLLGGRLFPGEHHLASFAVRETATEIELSLKSQDESTSVHVAGAIADSLPPASIFPSLAAASAFFEPGSLGYSVTGDPHRLDGLILKTKEWRVEALALRKAFSSYFADESRFPVAAIEYDHALLMRNIAHEWHSAADLYV